MSRRFFIGILSGLLFLSACNLQSDSLRSTIKPTASPKEVSDSDLQMELGALPLIPLSPSVSAPGKPILPNPKTDSPQEPIKLSGTVEVFQDYECPYCKRLAAEGLDPLRKRHPEVSILVRQFPLSIHPHALLAAKYAVCAASQGEFAKIDAALLTASDLTETNLKKIAKIIGLDEKKLLSCVSEKSTQALVEADISRGRSLGVVGTPTFFINGEKYEGAYPVENIERALREQKDPLLPGETAG